uniref:Ig-like domain-containing protein n=1 Tax=Cyprinodon variegatus TaxID=28743 RepID=A0A3Q2DSL5_CYPVA
QHPLLDSPLPHSGISSLLSGSDGQNVVVTQPAAKSVQLGQTVTIDCKANRVVDCSPPCLSWYQQKAGEAPKALIYLTSSRFSGISSRFTGNGARNEKDFTLTISGVQAEDAGVYYCQSLHSGPVFTHVSFFPSGSDGQNIVVTQPAAKSVQLGQTVTIDCKVSQALSTSQCSHNSQVCLSWYQQKPGEATKALIYATASRFSGISSRFTGSGAGNNKDFTLTISGVQAEDAGIYYCQSFHSETNIILGCSRFHCKVKVFVFSLSLHIIPEDNTKVVLIYFSTRLNKISNFYFYFCNLKKIKVFSLLIKK